MTWQPIETAPKDGTIVLTAHKTKDGIRVVPAQWRASRLHASLTLFGWHLCQWSDLNIEHSLSPTHWMPLPAPPREIT